jgi:hypothetical protein
MGLKPVLLETSLGAILDYLADTFWTGVEGDELLVEFLAFFHIRAWIINRVLLVFPDMLQWALVVLALADMDHLVIWGMGCLEADAHRCYIHHRRVVEATRAVETYAVVPAYALHVVESTLLRLVCSTCRLHNLYVDFGQNLR